MRLIILPSRLHTFRAYSWRAHSTLGNNVEKHPKENGFEVVDYINLLKPSGFFTYHQV